nr:hypothetical protein GCM10020093_089620 [Planobispora longispora]
MGILPAGTPGATAGIGPAIQTEQWRRRAERWERRARRWKQKALGRRTGQLDGVPVRRLRRAVGKGLRLVGAARITGAAAARVTGAAGTAGTAAARRQRFGR